MNFAKLKPKSRLFLGAALAVGIAVSGTMVFPLAAMAQNQYYGYAGCSTYPTLRSTASGLVKHQIAFLDSEYTGYIEKSWQNGSSWLSKTHRFQNHQAEWGTMGLSVVPRYKYWGCTTWATSP